MYKLILIIRITIIYVYIIIIKFTRVIDIAKPIKKLIWSIMYMAKKVIQEKRLIFKMIKMDNFLIWSKNEKRLGFTNKSRWAKEGRSVSDKIKLEKRANVFVQARGVKSFPEEPIKVNMGKKEIIVVSMAVKMAPLTSDVAS